MLIINKDLCIPEDEITLQAIRSQGAGGQNVNKVSSAIHLRFDIKASSLPEYYRNKLLELNDYRVSNDGVINIKAQEYKSQAKNRDAAIRRLINLIQSAIKPEKKRKPTKPTHASKLKRLEKKLHRSNTKTLRRRVKSEE